MSAGDNFGKRAPFLRLFIALATGIIIGAKYSFSPEKLLIAWILCFSFSALFSFASLKIRYRFGMVNGVSLSVMLVLTGAFLVWLHDIRNHKDWIGHHYKKGDLTLAAIEEPPVEKANSFKVVAEVQRIFHQTTSRRVLGKLILYLKKDSLAARLHYGTQFVFRKNLEEVRNSGNPGSFDYKKYCFFQSITHQAYLTGDEYVILPSENKDWFRDFIFRSREWIVQNLKKNIDGEKEQGLAEALLIGYKNDLDRDLVQAYSNTGVVHIIAVSGLHLGLIYALLLYLTRPLNKQKHLLWLRFLVIICSLWLFSILAGGQPSVLRSAVMFSFITGGEVLAKKTSLYNNLALSAFVLLCVNPFWLWDAGFQLSYSAVLSIMVFYRPVYNWVHSPNKILDFFWKLTAVTIAAQICTTPISIYHFHQVPLLFLLTNIVAVPLSSVILFGEIILSAIASIPSLAHHVGLILKYMIWFMNSFIEYWSRFPFSVWAGMSLSILQVCLLFLFLVSFWNWLREKSKTGLWISLLFLVAIASLRLLSFMDANGQKKIIVYNIPKYMAMDLVSGRNAVLVADSSLRKDSNAESFYLRPSRILHRLFQPVTTLSLKDFVFAGKHITIIDSAVRFLSIPAKPVIDLLVLSKNPKLYITNLSSAFSIRQVVIDSSVPTWKAKLWQQDCDSLHIPCFNVGEKGAYIFEW